MFSFGDKYRNYLCDNNGLYANLTLFLAFFKKHGTLFCFFIEANGICMWVFSVFLFHEDRMRLGSFSLKSKLLACNCARLSLSLQPELERTA